MLDDHFLKCDFEKQRILKRYNMKIWTSSLNPVLLGLKSCYCSKMKTEASARACCTVYNHTLPSQMCEIPGFPAICIHPSTNRALLQPAWLSVRGDVTPTAVCFSILFQAQEKGRQGCDIICLLCDRQLRSTSSRVEIATLSHPEEKHNS